MSKRIKFLSLFLSLLLVFFIAVPPKASVSAAASSTGYVTGTDVNIRSGPGTKYDKLGKISLDYVTVLGYTNGDDGHVWYQIKYGDITGYVIGDYLTLYEEKENSLKGDINGDNKIDNADLELVDKHIAGTAILKDNAFKLADTNGDGKVDATDRDKIKAHIDGTDNLYIAAFPESYQPALKTLQSLYPNYIFIADYINIPFHEAVYNEGLKHRKLVNMSADGISWRALGPENYNWTTGKWNTYSGNWTDASREVIAYYMDPRNFINIDGVYMFLQQSYSPSQTEEGVRQIIKNTFLANGYNDPNDTQFGGDYAKVIVEAAKQSNVSPYVLASTIILEQGTGGSSALIAGLGPDKVANGDALEGYYNFFNYGASGGSDDATVINNGLNYAKEAGWNSRSAAIIGGAKKYASGYIAVGQDTYYYKDFDVLDASPYTHQYAQSIYDARSSSTRLRSYYRDKQDMELIFRIPVYKDMDETPISQPPENEKLNNYYFKNISVGGLSPAFSMYTTEYTLSVSGNTVITVEAPEKAAYAGAASFELKAGENVVTLPVKSETGYLNNYKIKVTAAADCTLKISTGEVSVTLGDINSDGQINTADLAAIRLHLLGIRILSDTEFFSADINSDGQINTADLAGVRLHLLGLRPLN